MTRKLESIREDLDLLAEQGKIEGFLQNVGNADKLGGMLDGIRDAMMEYQVRALSSYPLFQRFIFDPDLITTRHL